MQRYFLNANSQTPDLQVDDLCANVLWVDQNQGIEASHSYYGNLQTAGYPHHRRLKSVGGASIEFSIG